METVITPTANNDSLLAALLAGINRRDDYRQHSDHTAKGAADIAACASIASAKDAIASTERTRDALDGSIDRAKDNLSLQITNLAQNVSTGFTAQALAECRNHADTLKGLCDTEARLSDRLCQNAERNALAHATTQALVSREACETRELVRDKACDIKELIRCDGDKTRALINDLELHKVREQLSDEKQRVSQLRQTIELSRVIRHAVDEETSTTTP